MTVHPAIRRRPRPGRLAAVALAALFAVTGTAAAGDLWLHVAVDEGPEGAKVRVNLPLSMAETALGMIPDEELRGGKVRFDDSDLTVAELRQLWRQLETSPDATFVEVEEADQRVLVSKSGGYLLVKAFEGGEESQQVDVRIPAAVVEALLSGEGDELDVAAAVRALAAHGEGELVTVTDAETHVRVWVDGRAETR